MDLEANIKAYLGARKATDHYSSFDYCFNHFQADRERAADLGSPEGMEPSCLHLGFTSRVGESAHPGLLRRSIKHFEPLIGTIAACPRGCGER